MYIKYIFKLVQNVLENVQIFITFELQVYANFFATCNSRINNQVLFSELKIKQL